LRPFLDFNYFEFKNNSSHTLRDLSRHIPILRLRDLQSRQYIKKSCRRIVGVWVKKVLLYAIWYRVYLSIYHHDINHSVGVRRCFS
jgi:hypothetical protein